jgi:hypothetical protein
MAFAILDYSCNLDRQRLDPKASRLPRVRFEVYLVLDAQRVRHFRSIAFEVLVVDVFHIPVLIAQVDLIELGILIRAHGLGFNCTLLSSFLGFGPFGWEDLNGNDWTFIAAHAVTL